MALSAHANRTALVIGAGRARGIGAATTIRQAHKGLSVAVADLVSPGEGAWTVLEGLEDTGRRIRDVGGHATVVLLDVTEPERLNVKAR